MPAGAIYVGDDAGAWLRRLGAPRGGARTEMFIRSVVPSDVWGAKVGVRLVIRSSDRPVLSRARRGAPAGHLTPANPANSKGCDESPRHGVIVIGIAVSRLTAEEARQVKAGQR